MDIDNYLYHYDEFTTEFNLPTDPVARGNKAIQEAIEFNVAFHHGTDSEADDEALDLMNTAISNVVARGFKNPLHAGYLKLQRTAEKYRERDLLKSWP